jgi:hypothetical protein
MANLYEKQRLENIKKNVEMLKMLGLDAKEVIKKKLIILISKDRL